MNFTMNSTKFYEAYEKLKTVGQGSFGTAVLYRRKVDGLQVVVKEIFVLDMGESERKSAMNEVEILSTLKHDYIIKYLGNFQKEESLVIIMEYADGGNLAQLINAKRNKNEIFGEKSILNITKQISSAIMYMHGNKILHRDLKAANIFLNINGTIKVGDFGISKMLNTKSQAQTVVGTPFYLSPEMCEGSDYNEKSDIWAIGCIIYELTCLKKPFEAATLPVLVQKIVSCHYGEIPDYYSQLLGHLIKSILQKDPSMRPSARYIHDTAIPRIYKNIEAINNSKSIPQSLKNIKERSVLYKLYDFGDNMKIVPIELPHKIILDFAVSKNHILAITSDGFVYAWGKNDFGQLGVSGDFKRRKYASCVTYLRDKQIKRCAAGGDFSLFLNAEGGLLSCGDGHEGCLGHGDWKSLSEPIPIYALKENKIEQIACGDSHAVALSSEGKVFTWGSSKYGQLGQGHTQQRCKPLAIKLDMSQRIKNIFCGSQCTFLLTTNGQILASGNNKHYKLGIPGEDIILMFTQIHVNIKERIKIISPGTNRTVLLSENGNVFIIGRYLSSTNNSGLNSLVEIVKFERNITMVTSGLNFTIAADNQNVLWFWGESTKTVQKLEEIVQSNSNSVIPLIQNLNENNTMVLKGFSNTKTEEVVTEQIKSPRSILALYTSRSNLNKKSNLIRLENIKAVGKLLYISVFTTAPPPIMQFGQNSISLDEVESEVLPLPPTFITELPNRPMT